MTSPYEEQDFDDTQELVKNRQRFFRRPRKAADVLSNLMARQGYGQVDSQQELISAWRDIVDPRMRAKTQVASVRSGVLEVIVSSSAVNQQLMFQKQQLLQQLQQRWSRNIRDLRFRVGAIHVSSPED